MGGLRIKRRRTDEYSLIAQGSCKENGEQDAGKEVAQRGQDWQLLSGEHSHGAEVD